MGQYFGKRSTIYGGGLSRKQQNCVEYHCHDIAFVNLKYAESNNETSQLGHTTQPRDEATPPTHSFQHKTNESQHTGMKTQNIPSQILICTMTTTSQQETVLHRSTAQRPHSQQDHVWHQYRARHMKHQVK